MFQHCLNVCITLHHTWPWCESKIFALAPNQRVPIAHHDAHTALEAETVQWHVMCMLVPCGALKTGAALSRRRFHVAMRTIISVSHGRPTHGQGKCVTSFKATNGSNHNNHSKEHVEHSHHEYVGPGHTPGGNTSGVQPWTSCGWWAPWMTAYNTDHFFNFCSTILDQQLALL